MGYIILMMEKYLKDIDGKYNMGTYKLVQIFHEHLKDYLFQEQYDEYFSEEDYEL